MSFSAIKGQDRPIGIIKESLKHGQMASGYLFIGPQGVGKQMVALELAKALNCQDGPMDACGNCPSCLKIDKGQHPDFHFLGRESPEDESWAIKIEDIRQLQKEISLRPYEGKKKIFILDNAHRLTADAANALLKILEEPPANSLIILITAKPALLFKTIISRCQVLKFSSLPLTALEDTLKNDYRTDFPQAHFLAHFCEGRLGYALKMKEEGMFRQKNAVIDEFGIPGKSGFSGLALEDKENLRLYLNILAAWLRDIYLLKTGVMHAQVINLDRRDELLRSMNRYTFAQLDDLLNYISDALLYLDQNVNIRLVIACLKSFMKG